MTCRVQAAAPGPAIEVGDRVRDNQPHSYNRGRLAVVVSINDRCATLRYSERMIAAVSAEYLSFEGKAPTIGTKFEWSDVCDEGEFRRRLPLIMRRAEDFEGVKFGAVQILKDTFRGKVRHIARTKVIAVEGHAP